MGLIFYSQFFDYALAPVGISNPPTSQPNRRTHARLPTTSQALSPSASFWTIKQESLSALSTSWNPSFALVDLIIREFDVVEGILCPPEEQKLAPVPIGVLQHLSKFRKPFRDATEALSSSTEVRGTNVKWSEFRTVLMLAD